MKCEMLQIADEASSRADELYKRYQLLHGALDFRLFFHPSHNIPVIREVPPPPQLNVHLLQCGKDNIWPRWIRAGREVYTMSGFLGVSCIFLLKIKPCASSNVVYV